MSNKPTALIALIALALAVSLAACRSEDLPPVEVTRVVTQVV